MVSLNGSNRAGVEVARAAAPSVKRVHQELGGKSPNIILDDEIFAKSVTGGVRAVMNNSGHGMVCHGEKLQFKGKFSTGKFRYPLDIAGMARAMGAVGLSVEKPGAE
jgi:hypothetical protein